MKRLAPVLASALLLLALGLPAVIHADSTVPDDRFALKGLQQTRTIFDVRLAELDK